MIPMREGNEHGIDLLMPGAVDGCRVAAQVPNPWPLDRVGEQANAVDFNEH